MNVLSKIFTLFFLISISMVACKADDPCKDKNCGANATCDDGTCICDAGYEADVNGACVEKRQKYLGTYNATETCNNIITISWNMTIASGSTTDLSQILLKNLGDYGLDVVATLDGNMISINYTDTATGINIVGTGTFTGNKLDFMYTASNSMATDNCVGTATKQ